MGSDFHPVPKPDHKRRTPKRKQRGEFKKQTILDIRERDKERCVKCGSYQIEAVPHHVIYKGRGGHGIKRNGVCICRPCHDWSHHKRKGPNNEPSADGCQWFIDWVGKNLDDDGNKVGDPGGQIREN